MNKMLQKSNFYTIQNIVGAADSIQATCVLNPTHEIFKGHFPGQPVVPGVCMFQMLKELLEQQMQQSFLMQMIQQAKFLTPLVPSATAAVQISMQWTPLDSLGLKVNASIMQDTTPILKCSAVFVPK